MGILVVAKEKMIPDTPLIYQKSISIHLGSGNLFRIIFFISCIKSTQLPHNPTADTRKEGF